MAKRNASTVGDDASGNGDTPPVNDGPDIAISEAAADLGSFTIDPAELGSGGASDPAERPKRKYTRRGSGTGRRKSASASLDVDAISATLFTIHGMLAAMIKQPSFAIDEEEAKILAAASQKVARHYDIPLASEKTIDWVNLFGAFGMVYGPRVVAMRMKRTEQRQKANVPVASITPEGIIVPNGFPPPPPRQSRPN